VGVKAVGHAIPAGWSEPKPYVPGGTELQGGGTGSALGAAGPPGQENRPSPTTALPWQHPPQSCRSDPAKRPTGRRCGRPWSRCSAPVKPSPTTRPSARPRREPCGWSRARW
jgi:hypothetical protein